MRRIAALFVPFLVLTLHAQTWTARHIVFKNPGPFAQAQLEAVAGMHAGQSVDAAAMQAAAQKLVDTGYFEDVGVVLDGTAANTSVVFSLKPLATADMLPLGFENFVWLTHDEIQRVIVARIPLYTGRLPETSPQADVVADALAEALAAKGVAGAHVYHENYEPTLYHPLRTMEFRVTQPQVRIANIKLTGVATELAPLIQKSVNNTAHSSYNDGLNGVLTSEILLQPLLDAGYIQATLDGMSTEVQGPVTNTAAVVVSARLSAGEIYHVSSLTFGGTPVYPAEKFAATAKLKAGDVASRKLLLESLRPIDDAYRKLGLIDVVVTAAPVTDDAAHTVAYTVGVIPGEPYHLHEMTPQGLPPAQLAAFTQAFTMHPGDVYNPIYVGEFFKNNTAARELAGCSGAFKAIAMPSTHTVDLFINFACPVNVKG